MRSGTALYCLRGPYGACRGLRPQTGLRALVWWAQPETGSWQGRGTASPAPFQRSSNNLRCTLDRAYLTVINTGPFRTLTPAGTNAYWAEGTGNAASRDSRSGGRMEEGREDRRGGGGGEAGGLAVRLQHDCPHESEGDPPSTPLGNANSGCTQCLAPKEMFIPAVLPQPACAGRVTGPRPLTLQVFPERPPKSGFTFTVACREGY